MPTLVLVVLFPSKIEFLICNAESDTIAPPSAPVLLFENNELSIIIFAVEPSPCKIAPPDTVALLFWKMESFILMSFVTSFVINNAPPADCVSFPIAELLSKDIFDNVKFVSQHEKSHHLE